MKYLNMTLILITTLFTVYDTPIFGQSNNKSAQFGIKGGLNFSNLYVDDVDDNNVLTSINAGIYTTIPLTSFIAIQPELLYSRKGAELVYNNALIKGTAEFNLNYLEIPILLKINPSRTFNIHAGAYGAYLLNAKVKNSAQNNSFNFEQEVNTDDFHNFDYGLTGGFGFDHGILGFGARYNYGMSTVGKEKVVGNSTYIFPGGKNSNLSIFMAIRLQ